MTARCYIGAGQGDESENTYPSGSGSLSDVLRKIAHEHGALLVVDATQSAGMVPINVTNDDVDVLVAGSYK